MSDSTAFSAASSLASDKINTQGTFPFKWARFSVWTKTEVSFFPPSAALPLDPIIRHSTWSPLFSVSGWCICHWAASGLNALGAEIMSFCVKDNEWGRRDRGESRNLGLQHNKRSYELWCYKNSSVGSSNHWHISVVVYDVYGTCGESASPVIQFSELFSVCHCLWAACSRQVLSHPFSIPTL